MCLIIQATFTLSIMDTALATHRGGTPLRGARAPGRGLRSLLEGGVVLLFAASIVFSIVGMALMGTAPRIIAWAGPLLPWFMRVPTWIYMIGLPVLAVLMYAPDLGWRRMVSFVAFGSVIGLLAELIGTSTGIPFGAYRYTSFLDPKILGHVPVLIPLSWFAVGLISYDLAGRLGLGRVGRIGAAALILTLWDVVLDPAMSRGFPVWIWEVDGPYYGMPLVNWAGWLVTGLVIATGFDALGFDRHARHSPLAVKVWILNGIFPIGICAVRGMTGAAVVGSVAIMLPVVLSMRRQPDVAPASA